MNNKSKTSQALLFKRFASPSHWVGNFQIISAVILAILLVVNALPAGARSTMHGPARAPALQTASTLTVVAAADASVQQRNPTTNYGTATFLDVVTAANRSIESYLQFTVSGASGTIQSARVRVYSTTDGTKNGPALYATGSTWTETGITWNNRPARTSSALGNKGSIAKNTWVEYDVTSRVTGNGTYSFVLAGDSNDNVRFSSRQGGNPPQLVITLNNSTPTATRTPTSASNPTQTPTATRTPTPLSNPTQTRTPTPTATSSSGSVVLVGAGDISSCSNNNDEATAQLLDGISGTVFNAGDNAYSSGSLTEYTSCYDPTWGRHKARTKPVPGNHEYATSGAAGYFQYFNNPPAYYAYNLGAWRIYALNSEIDVSASGAEATWLQSDLNANPTQCVLAYWHKPRWSSGSTHGSTSSMQTLWQILYNAGAEIVINGHEHNYERFAEMNASGAAVSPGLREFVVGTGGIGHYGFGTALTSSEVRNSTAFGVLKLTLRAGGYDWQFVPVAGATFTDSGSGICH